MVNISAHGTHTSDGHGFMVADFKRRFIVSCILSFPILLLSPHIQSFMGFSLSFPGSTAILFILSTILYFYGGRPFLKGLYNELLQRRPGMMTLVGTAITVAYLYSSAIVFGLQGELFFWELATLINVMLFGHWIEMRSLLAASRSLEHIAQLLPFSAHRIEQGNIKEVRREMLKKGDKVVVKPGEKIPADGVIQEGESEVNEAVLTGESLPRFKSKGDRVIAGAINGTGSFVISVEKNQENLYIRQVMSLVKQVMEGKSGVQDKADRVAFGLTILALIGGFGVGIVWFLFLSKPLPFALERVVTVMVTACPHALGLAVPLVIAYITTYGAQKGILIRNRRAFEAAYVLDTVLFDKTGTLTTGTFEVTDIESFGSFSSNEILFLAASVEHYSEHHLARAIVLRARELKLSLHDVREAKLYPGKGTIAYVGERTVMLGNLRLFQDQGVDYDGKKINSKKINSRIIELSSQGKTAVLVGIDRKVEGIIGLADTIREESYEACVSLKKEGLKLALITGDNKDVAYAVAQKLGIDVVLAQVLPEQKAAEVQRLQNQGLQIAMVGDGINDAPALAQADLGIAFGAGSDLAQETADIILVQNDPRRVVDVIHMARVTQRKMNQNLFLATVYNVVALPIAAGMLYPWGIILDPAIGALMMAASTIIVAVNSRLKPLNV